MEAERNRDGSDNVTCAQSAATSAVNSSDWHLNYDGLDPMLTLFQRRLRFISIMAWTKKTYTTAHKFHNL